MTALYSARARRSKTSWTVATNALYDGRASSDAAARRMFMTYCLAIKVDDGLILASDSRTHAGVDYVSTYSKMHMFGAPGDRFFVLLTAGSLSTTQAVVNTIKRDLENPSAELSLDTVEYVFDAAHYIGAISYRVQQERAEALKQSGASAEATFILGGQIRGQTHEIYLIYPPGNNIAASPPKLARKTRRAARWCRSIPPCARTFRWARRSKSPFTAGIS